MAKNEILSKNGLVKYVTFEEGDVVVMGSTAIA